MKRVGLIATAVVLAVSGLGVLSPQAYAAGQTCTWTGSGGDSKFSTVGNWTNCGGGAPTADDTLAFSVSSLGADATLNNDLSGLSVSGITFSGTSATYSSYVISGNSLIVTGNITNTATDGDSYAGPLQSAISSPLVLGADVTVSEVNLSGAITTAGHTLTISASWVCGLAVSGAIAGAGSVVISTPSTSGVNISGDNSSFTGSFSAGSGSRVGFTTVSSIGQASGITATNAEVVVGLDGADRTLSTPLNLSGTLYSTKYRGSIAGCMGSSGGSVDTTTYSLTLSGALALNGNLEYYGTYVNTVAGGTYSANGHATTVKSGSNGTLTLPSGTVDIPAVTNEYKDNTPTQYINAGNKVTAIVSGTVGNVYVSAGGLVKGTGIIVGNIDVEDKGVIAPGNSPGCLTSETLMLYGEYQFELGGTDPCTGYDQLKVLNAASASTAVSLGSDTSILTTSRYNNYTPTQGQVFTIIDQSGTALVSGTFKDLPEGATFEQNGVVFKISYVGGTGNDVTLTVQNTPTAPATGIAILRTSPALIAGATILGVMVMLGIARLSAKRR